MTFAPLLIILIILVIGTTVTLAFVFVAERLGQFRHLEKGAAVIFDPEEPAGEVERGADRESTVSKDSTTEKK